MSTESIFSESVPQIKTLDRNLSAFTTLFALGKSWDKVRSTVAPYKESRLTRSVTNERVGFPVVEHSVMRLFASGFFHDSPSLQPLKITLGSFQIFSKNSRRYLQVKVHHRCQRHQRQIMPPVSLVLLIPVAKNGNNIRLQTP